MIVNTVTGEIIEKPLDLQPLRHKPRGRVSRPERAYRQRRPDIQLKQDIAVAVVMSAIILGMSIG